MSLTKSYWSHIILVGHVHAIFNNKRLFVFFFLAKEHQLISIDKRKKEYKEERGNKPKTFSKGDVSKVGHSQLIFDVLSPNKVRNSIKPK